ncbi:MAG: AarF/UbiB family protein [Hyphomonadaceae bacterium]
MLQAIADYMRLFRAGAVMIRHDVVMPDELRARAPLPARVAGGVLRLFGGDAGRGKRPGQRFASALEKLGPAWIKLGQFLATRPDVIGVTAANDLSRLKDALPAFPKPQVKRSLEDAFGADAARLFPNLSDPVAAASVAQVHRLETEDGPRAVKILRPGVERVIERELRAMKRAAALAAKRGDAELRRLEPVAFVDTMARSLTREMDLRFEAAAASEFREIAALDNYVYAPDVDWLRTSRRVLTTTWIDGKGLTDPDVLNGVDRADLANRITRGFLACALDHGFFHADVHEGNMILAPDGRLFMVDFGIMGRIGRPERRFLAEILAGFLARDYQRVAEVHFEAGYVPADNSHAEFAQALRSVGEPIFGKSAREVAMSRVLLQLFDITRQFGMHLRPELILLQKTMVQVEGVSRAIDPDHDIWQAAKPVVDRWTRNEFGPPGVARTVREALKDGLIRLRRLPQMMDALEAAIARANEPPAPPPKRAPRWLWTLAGLGLGSAVVGAAWWLLETGAIG